MKCFGLLAAAVLFLTAAPASAQAPAGVVGWRGDWTGRYPDATPVTEWEYRPMSPNWGLRYQLAKPKAGDTGRGAVEVKRAQVLEWLALGPFEPKEAVDALNEEFIHGEDALSPDKGEKAGGLVWTKQSYPSHVVFGNPELDLLRFDSIAKGKPGGLVYAHAYLYSQTKGKVVFFLDQSKGAKLWVNGKVVHNNPKQASVTPGLNYVCYAANEHWAGELLMLGDNKGAQKIPVELEQGWNRVLFKTNGWLNLRFVEAPDVAYVHKNIVWVAKLPNWSNAMPIIVGGKLFVMSEPDELVCLNKADGRILWTRHTTFVDAASAADRQKFAQFKELDALNTELKKTPDMGARVPLRVKMMKRLHEVDREDAKGNAEFQEVYRLQAVLKDAKSSDADKAAAVEGIKKALAGLSMPREINPLYQVILPIEKQMAKPETKEADKAGMTRKLQEFVADLGPKPKYPLHPSSHIGGIGYSCPTPISDGRRVWVLPSGFGIAACYDLDGNLQWATLLTDMSETGMYHNASPILADGKLIIVRGSGMRALDAATGRALWTSTDLRTEVGVDLWHGFGTGASFSSSPCLVTIAGAPYVFFDSAIVRVSDGKVFAQIHLDLSGNVRTTPFVFGDSIYVAGNFKMTRIPIPAEAKEGMVLAKVDNEKWEPGDICFFASPVIVDGRIYDMRHDGKLWVYNAASVAQAYVQDLGMDWYQDYDHAGCVASLAQGGRHVFAFSNTGTGVVIEPDPAYKEVARNRLAFCVERIWNYEPVEIFNVGPIFEGGRMYLRGEQNLYCIGKQ